MIAEMWYRLRACTWECFGGLAYVCRIQTKPFTKQRRACRHTGAGPEVGHDCSGSKTRLPHSCGVSPCAHGSGYAKDRDVRVPCARCTHAVRDGVFRVHDFSMAVRVLNTILVILVGSGRVGCRQAQQGHRLYESPHGVARFTEMRVRFSDDFPCLNVRLPLGFVYRFA